MQASDFVIHERSRQLQIPATMANVFNRNISNSAHEALHEFSSQGIRCFAFSPSGGWLLVSNRNQFVSHDIPVECRDQIDEFIRQGQKILCVSFPSNGGNRWSIITDRGFRNRGIPDECHRKMLEFHRQGHPATSVAFTSGNSDGWVVINASGFFARNIPDECYQIMRNINQGRRRVRSVAFDTDNRGWLVLAGDYFFARNVNDQLYDKARQFNRDRWIIKSVAFDPDRRGWSIVANTRFRNRVQEPIRDFEGRISGTSIWNHMRNRNVPGVAVATVINNRLAWSTGYGYLKRGSGAAVHPESTFQAASISKVMAALGVLRAVRLGLVDLDTDVSTLLKSWSLSVANGISGQATLRHLLSHSGGTNVGGFDGYQPGESIPTKLQILNGQNPPANNDPIRVVYEPGSNADYSGGGFQVLEQVLADVTNVQFADWMHLNLFSQIGMDSTVFATSAPRDPLDKKQVAAGHGSDGRPIDGDRNSYPESAAAGAYSTVLDLARMIIFVNRGGRVGNNPVLRATQIEDLLTPQHGFRTNRRIYGLGTALSQRTDRDSLAFNYFHGGTNRGFRCAFRGFPNRRSGVAVMTNGNDRSLRWEVADAVAEEYGWTLED